MQVRVPFCRRASRNVDRRGKTPSHFRIQQTRQCDALGRVIDGLATDTKSSTGNFMGYPQQVKSARSLPAADYVFLDDKSVAEQSEFVTCVCFRSRRTLWQCSTVGRDSPISDYIPMIVLQPKNSCECTLPPRNKSSDLRL
jgi:hypothetical protein